MASSEEPTEVERAREQEAAGKSHKPNGVKAPSKEELTNTTALLLVERKAKAVQAVERSRMFITNMIMPNKEGMQRQLMRQITRGGLHPVTAVTYIRRMMYDLDWWVATQACCSNEVEAFRVHNTAVALQMLDEQPHVGEKYAVLALSVQVPLVPRCSPFTDDTKMSEYIDDLLEYATELMAQQDRPVGAGPAPRLKQKLFNKTAGGEPFLPIVQDPETGVYMVDAADVAQTTKGIIARVDHLQSESSGAYRAHTEMEARVAALEQALKRAQAPRGPKQMQQPAERVDRDTCKKCKKKGHWARDCPF